MVHTGGVFSRKDFSKDCFTHDFGTLVKLAGLQLELDAKIEPNSEFQGFWGTVTNWNETSRYEQNTEQDAKALYHAINTQPNGVMQWIRNYW